MSIDLNPQFAIARKFYQDLKLNGKAPRTQQSYVRHLRKFTEFLGRSPDSCSEDDCSSRRVHSSVSAARVAQRLSRGQALWIHAQAVEGVLQVAADVGHLDAQHGVCAGGWQRIRTAHL